MPIGRSPDRGNACALHALIQGVDRAAVRLQALRLALIVMPTDSSSLWNDQPLLEVSEDAWVGPECRNRCRWLADDVAPGWPE
jgi:hypothetical protein